MIFVMMMLNITKITIITMIITNSTYSVTPSLASLMARSSCSFSFLAWNDDDDDDDDDYDDDDDDDDGVDDDD
jgi:hypothetical protein